MAIPNVIAGACEVRVLWDYAGELAVNTMGFQIAGALTIDAALAEQVETAIKGAFTAQLATHIATNVSLLHTGLRDLRQAHLPEYLGTSAAVPGTAVGDPLPPRTALGLTLRTAGAGKSFRGRQYLGGFTEGENSTSAQASAAAIAAAIAYVGGIQTSLNALGLTLAVLTHPQERVTIVRTTFHADGTTTVRTMSTQTAKSGAANRVTLIESRDPRWESQSRRGNGRGTNGVAALATSVKLAV